MNITRKQFLETALTALGAMVALGAAGCSSSDNSSSSGGGDCSKSNAAVTIEANHGHVLKVTPADVKAAVGKTYHIKGSANHDHTVTLGAPDFQQLAQGQTVYKTSTLTNNHQHPITIVCG
jgi:hypothetical protein